MTYAQIEKLLARFMQGTTTLEEEARLADYFRTATNIPQEWEDYREMFAFIEAGCLEKHTDLGVRGTGGCNGNGGRRVFRYPFSFAISAVAAALVFVFFLIWPKEKTQELVQGTEQMPKLPAVLSLPEVHDSVEVLLAETLERQKEQNRASLRSRQHVQQPKAPEPILLAVCEEQLPESAPVVAPSFTVEQEPLVAPATLRPASLTDDQLLDLQLALLERQVAAMESMGDALLDDTDLLTGGLIFVNETNNP